MNYSDLADALLSKMLNHVVITIGLDDLIAIGVLIIIGICILTMVIAAKVADFIEHKRKGK